MRQAWLARLANRKTFFFALLLLSVGVIAGCSAPTADEYLNRARAYLAAGEDDAAVIELRNALKLNVSLVDARAELADLLFASGDYQAAAADYERALEGFSAAALENVAESSEAAKSSRERALRSALNLCKIRTRRAAEVIAELAPVDDLPVDPDQRALLGHARLALDDIELAERDFSEAVSRLQPGDQGYSLAHFGAAIVAWQAGDSDLAAASFERAAQGDTRDPKFLLSKADFELSQNDPNAARETFERLRQLPGNDLQARLGGVRVHIFEADYPAASTELESILTVAPDLIPAIYLQALVAYEKKDLDAAQLYLRQVLSRDANYAQALYLMGAVQFQQEDYLQAEANLSAYVRRHPDAASARKLLGAVRMQTGNHEGVVAALASATNDSDAQTLAMLGTAYARLGRLNEASALLDQAVEMAPDVGELRNQLAVTLLAAGDSDGAIGQLESAIELNGELQLSDYLLVLAQLRNGKIDEALQAANALRERAPDDPMGYNLLGAVRFAQSDIDAARTAFLSALAVDNAFQPAALNLVRLELAEGNREAALAGLRNLLDADADNEQALMQLAELELTAFRSGQEPGSDRVGSNGAGSANSGPAAVGEGEEGRLRTEALARAKDYLQHAARAHAGSLGPRLALARLALLSGDVDGAERESAEALRLAPDNPTVLAVHVEALLRAGKTQATAGPLKLLEKQLNERVVPVSGGAGASAGRGESENFSRRLTLARLFERAGQTDRARYHFEKLLQSPTDSRDQALLALVRFDLNTGELAGAREKLVKASPAVQSSELYRVLDADVLRLTGDTEEARLAYEKLLAEGSREALFRLVALHTAAGDGQRASDLLSRWIEAHPDDAGAEVALATSALGRGDYAMARKRFEAVLAQTPDNVVVLNNLAWLYQQTGDSRARETAEKAWDLAPDSADVADTYGWILVGAGETERGRDVLLKANRMAPRNLSIGYHAASALYQTGRTEQALAILNTFGLDAAGEAESNASQDERSKALALLLKLVAIDKVEVESE